MKKYLLIVIAGFSFSANSQEIGTPDAVRYAQDNLNGTARYRAMSGAFGALGGDLSAINVNPAGSAIFTNNQFGATLSNYSIKNKSNYFGTETTENNNAFDLNQVGAVFVFDNDDEGSNWKKLTLAVNYENANNFDNTRFSAGTNSTNSVGNYFLNFANMGVGADLDLLTTVPGESVSDLYAYLGENFSNGFQLQQALLVYQGYIINPNDGGNGSPYTSNIPGGGNFYQENIFESTGYNGKVTFNAAAQYKDKLYFGLNLNSHFSDYRQITSIFESNSNNIADGVQRLRFTNEVYTYGSGFSFQLGTIAKITNEFRFGLTYESPTWMRLYDELTQQVSSVRSEDNAELPATIVNPQITNVYEGYELQTPGKWTGSLAYVFGKKGLISLDYAIKDYSNTQFGPDNDYRDLNNEMANILDTAGEIRIGAEYRIKEFSLRGGFRAEESPYKDKDVMGDLTGFSGGVGYNFGSTKLDLAYSYAQRDYQAGFLSSGLTDPANFKSVNNNVSLTLLFEL